jgi:hypothetical protein
MSLLRYFTAMNLNDLRFENVTISILQYICPYYQVTWIDQRNNLLFTKTMA